MSLSRLFWWVPFGGVPELDPGELARRLEADEPIQLLDVRTHGEWRRGHIPGAVNLPITGLADHLDELGLVEDAPVVAICLSAHRSIPAVRLLRRRGFEDVRQLRGGMLAWRRAGLPEIGEGES